MTNEPKKLLKYFTEKFKNKLNFPSLLSYGNYVHNKENIKVICKDHGKMHCSVANLKISDYGCPLCGIASYTKTHEQFIQELLLQNEYFRIGSFKLKTKYTTTNNKIRLEDKYGEYEMTASTLLRGSKPSLKSCINKEKYVLNRFFEIHKTTYSYPVFKYISVKTKIPIICKEHGKFMQSIDGHFVGKGCKKCAIKYTNKNFRKQSWGYKVWKKYGQESKNFDGYKVYIIKCWNDNEEFYKIGKTFNTVDFRLVGNAFPYNYKVVHIIASSYDAYYISNEEKRLQKLNKNYKYLPKIEFRGMHECFSSLDGLELEE